MNQWQSGLCDCCNDYRLCCYGCWCTSCLYGENAVMFDGSDYSDACWTFLAASRNPFAMMEIIKNRTALRMKYRLPEEPCDDCLVMSCCTPCAVCQATRELKYRISLPNPIPGIPMMVQPTNDIVYMQPVISTEPVSFIHVQ